MDKENCVAVLCTIAFSQKLTTEKVAQSFKVSSSVGEHLTLLNEVHSSLASFCSGSFLMVMQKYIYYC